MESNNHGASAPKAMENIMNLRPKAVVVWKGDNYAMVALKAVCKAMNMSGGP